ncbi:MAG TPA: enolase C-terminal domain-like protein [Natronosporangium sp.]|nr:enolase C-terminal domain-like protein [Natronosporangium sp.]
MVGQTDQVQRVDVATYSVPTSAPEADGTFTWDATTVVAVTVTTGAVRGLGWTYGTRAAATVIRDLLAPAVTGRDVHDVPGCFEAMRRAARNAIVPGVVTTAISAMDVALWDAKAKLLGTPLSRLFGVGHEPVPVYGSGGFTSYDDDQLRTELSGWVHQQGIPRVKIKIGESWGRAEARDLHRMRLAREVIGPEAELFVDANGGYQAKQAVRVAHAATDLDVRWFEEPVSSDNLAGLAEVRAAVTADIAAGEYGTDPGYFRQMCAAGAVDCLQIDLTRCGGFTGFLRAAAVADSFGLQVSSHTAPQLHLRVAPAVPNLRHLEWFTDHVRLEQRLFDGVVTPVDGMLPVAVEAPGHGMTLKAADSQAFRTA